MSSLLQNTIWNPSDKLLLTFKTIQGGLFSFLGRSIETQIVDQVSEQQIYARVEGIFITNADVQRNLLTPGSR